MNATLITTIATAAKAARSAAVAVAATPVAIQSCPTCLSYGGDPLPGDPPVDTLQTCPTCGVASVEWTLAVEIDATIDRLSAFDHLLNVVLDED